MKYIVPLLIRYTSINMIITYSVYKYHKENIVINKDVVLEQTY